MEETCEDCPHYMRGCNGSYNDEICDDFYNLEDDTEDDTEE